MLFNIAERFRNTRESRRRYKIISKSENKSIDNWLSLNASML